MDMYLKENLRTLRAFMGLTQVELSEATNIHVKSIGAYEEGKAEPSIDTLRCLAKFFGVKVDDILKCKIRKFQVIEIEKNGNKKLFSL
jgi:transcriptional regulator with XRE-family HTH domain